MKSLTVHQPRFSKMIDWFDYRFSVMRIMPPNFGVRRTSTSSSSWISNSSPGFELTKNILERLKSITVNLANFQFIYHHQKCMVWSYKTFIVTSIIIEHRTHRKQNFKLFQTSKKPVLFQLNMGSGK